VESVASECNIEALGNKLVDPLGDVLVDGDIHRFGAVVLGRKLETPRYLVHDDDTRRSPNFGPVASKLADGAKALFVCTSVRTI
jgi:hypothetical protein